MFIKKHEGENGTSMEMDHIEIGCDWFRLLKVECNYTEYGK